MKKLQKSSIVLLIAFFTVLSLSANAQDKDKKKVTKNPTKVSRFEEGRTLSESDLGFLNAVVADKKGKSRGAATEAVTIDNSTYKVGQVLNADDAAKIAKAIADSKNSKKVKNKDKSRGDCNLWCYYYLQDAYGYWYYYYYCCG